MIYFLYILVIIGKFIKHYNKELYICYKSDGQRSSIRPTSCSRDKATDWKMNFLSNENVKIMENTTFDVFNITETMFLSLFPDHNGPNQIFKFERLTKTKYHIKNNGHCLEFEPVYNQYIINNCKYINNQLFTILNLNQMSPEPENIPDKELWAKNDDSEVKSKYNRQISRRKFD